MHDAVTGVFHGGHSFDVDGLSSIVGDDGTAPLLPNEVGPEFFVASPESFMSCKHAVDMHSQCKDRLHDDPSRTPCVNERVEPYRD